MDFVSMIFAFALKNPQATNQILQSYSQPGQVEQAQLNSSLADFAQQALQCYHPSARFRGVDVLASSWPEQAKYGAQESLVIRIYLQGWSGTPYQMTLVAMAKDGHYRSFVLHEDTMVRYNQRCRLERWTAAQSQD